MTLKESVDNTLTAIGDALPSFNSVEKEREKAEKAKLKQMRDQCIAQGGTWTGETCVFNKKEEDTQQLAAPPATETFRESEINRVSGVQIKKGDGKYAIPTGEVTATGIRKTRPATLEEYNEWRASMGLAEATPGATYLGLTPDEARELIAQQQAIEAQPAGTQPAGTTQNLLGNTQGLLAQLGQLGQTGELTPSGMDYGRAATTGLREAIPSTISTAITFAGIGALKGGTTGTAGGPGGALLGAGIGAAAGFVGGMASSILGDMKDQRRESVAEQARTLEEGKQNLQDWVTLAASDPTNRAYYLSQFNKQLTLISQAHAQMKIDTDSDVLKFESARQDLAEFSAFYSVGGERDFLIREMRDALMTPATTDSYPLLELSSRRYDDTQTE